MVVGLLIGLVVGAGGVWLLLRTKTDDLTARFNALAADALRQNNETFLDIASDKLGQGEHAVAQLVQPLKESLTKVAEQTEALERSRRQDYGSLHESLETLVQSNEGVRTETSRLATALRSSEVRGGVGSRCSSATLSKRPGCSRTATSRRKSIPSLTGVRCALTWSSVSPETAASSSTRRRR